MSDTLYQTRDGDMLDAICFKHYGHLQQVTEPVLEHNQGLAQLGPIYPEGIIIRLPKFVKPTQTNTINLWD